MFSLLPSAGAVGEDVFKLLSFFNGLGGVVQAHNDKGSMIGGLKEILSGSAVEVDAALIDGVDAGLIEGGNFESAGAHIGAVEKE